MLNRKNSFLLHGDAKVPGKSMQILSQIMQHIYIPLESSHSDTKMNLSKFILQINQSSQQITGTVNIVIPESQDELTDQEAIKNKGLMDKYETYLERWTNTIRQILAKEQNKKADANSALAEIEYWRSRSATLSNLHQQLSHPFVNPVKRVNYSLFLKCLSLFFFLNQG